MSTTNPRTTSKKTGGLGHNPLLTSTEEVGESTAETQPAETRVSTQTRARVNKATRVHADVSVVPVAEMPVDTQTRGRVDAPTSKFTFYFTDAQLDRLDTLWEQLRRGNRGSGQRLTKSHVVRVALDRLLDDFDRDPEQVLVELKQQMSR